MVDFTLGITFKFERKKAAGITGQVFYKDGQHIIEMYDPKDATKFIKYLIPPLPEEMMTKEESKKESHGIG